MARLSGLPSEHHHEGPGDAPRRRRGRTNKTMTSSEDMPKGKRPLSPVAEATQTKRARRASTPRNHDPNEEVKVQTPDESSAVHRRVRRHSEPPVTAPDEGPASSSHPPASTQPAPGLTPHLDRIGASRTRFTNTRRARMSMPAQLHVEHVDEAEEDGTHIQYAPLTAVLDSRTRRRLRRSHLSQEVIEFEDHQKKDKKLLLELRRQLRVQDDKIQDLEFRLEARRLGDIEITDEHAEELELQLAQARVEIDELRASSLYNGDDTPTNVSVDNNDEEGEGLLLVNPDELHFSQDLDIQHTPNDKYTSRVLELASQVTFESLPGISQLSHDTLTEDGDRVVPDKLQDKAVERYERELQHYTRLLAESQGALRLVTIELQNLHFIDDGASTSEILLEMRRGFASLHAEVEKYFPNITADLTNGQLLQKIPQLFSGVFFELQEKLSLLGTSQKTEVLLRRQYEGVLDLLGESDERMQQLQNNLYTLDKSNDANQRTILDLEERVTDLTTLNNDREFEIKESNAQIQSLCNENEEKESSLSRLREAIGEYRVNLETITKTIAALEEEHGDTISRMEQEHAEAIQELQDELNAEADSREAAEAEAQQRQEYIEELESRIVHMESDVDIITTEMTALRHRLTAQTEAREVVEGERDAAADLVDQHACAIDNMNEQIADLKEQLAELRTNVAAEQSQREKTEADLDEANDQIEDLNNRVHNTGIQANELRSKLFELQQEKDATTAQLQEEAQDREDDLEQQLSAERVVREAAETTIAQLEQQIADTQDDLGRLESSLVDMTEARDGLEQERDMQVADVTSQLADLKAKLVALENSTDSTITSLEANITDLNNQVKRQQTEIKHLVEEAYEKDNLHTEEKGALQEKIDDLQDQLDARNMENEDYRRENASLSKRVEDEAQELLNIVGSHSEQVGALTDTISAHEVTIANLQASSTKQKADLEEEIEEHSREIAELQLVGNGQEDTISALENQILDLKARFEAVEGDTRAVVDKLMASQRALQEQNEQLVATLKARNAEALSAVKEMKLQRIEVKTQAVNLHSVAHGKITKTADKVKIGKKSRKKPVKRQWDSGVGVDENVEDVNEPDLLLA